ncbi:c-type cytochrome [Solimonas flava]|uniref:c-type cytochrome n=1 Tax=Solimonas flava TaxID=415849 RepID=UPI00040240BD|nr:c-type cytochrome [Solimonas flava]
MSAAIMKRRALGALLGLGTLALLAAAGLWLFGPVDRQDGDAPPLPAGTLTTDARARGEQLVRLGDCRACHTARGGAAYAGGRAVPTPFGTFYAPNITPDAETGIGQWSADDFWRALHEGKGRDGRPLYPTFPYTNFTRVSRADADAMYAYLRAQPAVRQANRPHELKFPYRFRPLLRGWRLLFFRPGVYQPDPAQSAEWNRGAYLVQGLGHCSACHEARNALGAIRAQDNPSGGLVLNWYAPALASRAEAGVQDWSEDEIVALLKTGVSARATTMGPMAEVVYESLQHVDPAELRAIAVYLKSLHDIGAPPASGRQAPPPKVVAAMKPRGERLYREHCAQCHGDDGEGRAPAAPALAGNRAVLMNSAVDPIRIVLFGGYAPGTAGNPRPYGMPPFAPTLGDEQIAEVLSYVRSAWGNDARPIGGAEVRDNRGGPLW